MVDGRSRIRRWPNNRRVSGRAAEGQAVSIRTYRGSSSLPSHARRLARDFDRPTIDQAVEGAPTGASARAAAVPRHANGRPLAPPPRSSHRDAAGPIRKNGQRTRARPSDAGTPVDWTRLDVKQKHTAGRLRGGSIYARARDGEKALFFFSFAFFPGFFLFLGRARRGAVVPLLLARIQWKPGGDTIRKIHGGDCHVTCCSGSDWKSAVGFRFFFFFFFSNFFFTASSGLGDRASPSRRCEPAIGLAAVTGRVG